MIGKHRAEMEQIITDFDLGRSVKAPFQFWSDLQNDQVKVVSMLEGKVSELVRIAETLISENKKTPKQDSTSLKERIFEVCKMLFDQQKAQANILSYIETELAKVRKQFTERLLSKRAWAAP